MCLALGRKALPQAFFMYLCYLDESGSPEIGKDTTHFVFVGLAIPATAWKEKDAAIRDVKNRFGLAQSEIHTGWMARRYVEQEKIGGFEAMDWPTRRQTVEREREATLLRIATLKGPKEAQNQKRNFRKTLSYIHLTRDERMDCLRAVADLVGSWHDCRLFAEAIDKTAFGLEPPRNPPFEEAFTQVVSRFHGFLEKRGGDRDYGLLVQDNNPTAATRLTELMRHFHRGGTLFTKIRRIVETPFFVDSQLTSCVQLSDLAAFSVRRFFENTESDLFDRIYGRFEWDNQVLVGLRHYTGTRACQCRVCVDHHRRPKTATARKTKRNLGRPLARR